MLNKLFYTEKLKKTVLVVDDEYINRELLGGMLEDDFVKYDNAGTWSLSGKTRHCSR